MKLKPLVLSILLLFSISVFAQQKVKSVTQQSSKPTKTIAKGTIFFQSTTLNLGEVDEDKGKAQGFFYFENIGKGELRILSIESGCGCTHATWETDRVYKQGEKGVVKISFNPENLEGEISRTLIVTTNGEPQITNLIVTGTVFGTTRSLSVAYPVVIGGTRLSTSLISIPHALSNRHDSVTISLYNASNKLMRINGVKTPDYIRATIDVQYLQPKEASDITFAILPEVLQQYGPIEDHVIIVTDEVETPLKKLSFRANVEENFSNLTEKELKLAPKITFKEQVKDLGEVYYGEVVEYDFEIINKGKSDLVLRRAYGSCGCTVAKVPSEPIKKGKTGKVSIRFDAKNLYGNQIKTITLISNDPNQPITTLTIKAQMIEPGVKK